MINRENLLYLNEGYYIDWEGLHDLAEITEETLIQCPGNFDCMHPDIIDPLKITQTEHNELIKEFTDESYITFNNRQEYGIVKEFSEVTVDNAKGEVCLEVNNSKKANDDKIYEGIDVKILMSDWKDIEDINLPNVSNSTVYIFNNAFGEFTEVEKLNLTLGKNNHIIFFTSKFNGRDDIFGYMECNPNLLSKINISAVNTDLEFLTLKEDGRNSGGITAYIPEELYFEGNSLVVRIVSLYNGTYYTSPILDKLSDPDLSQIFNIKAEGNVIAEFKENDKTIKADIIKLDPSTAVLDKKFFNWDKENNVVTNHSTLTTKNLIIEKANMPLVLDKLICDNIKIVGFYKDRLGHPIGGSEVVIIDLTIPSDELNIINEVKKYRYSGASPIAKKDVGEIKIGKVKLGDNSNKYKFNRDSGIQVDIGLDKNVRSGIRYL